MLKPTHVIYPKITVEDLMWKGFNIATAWISQMIKIFELVNPRGTVLDPFAGLHTTGIACILYNREFEIHLETAPIEKYIGIELNEKYHKLGQKRIERWLEYLNLRFFCDVGDKIVKYCIKNMILALINGDCFEFFDKLNYDWIITSPPYFAFIKYSNDEKDLGNITSYDEYLKKLCEIVDLHCNIVLILGNVTINRKLYKIPEDLAKLRTPDMIIEINKGRYIEYALVYKNC